MITRTRLLLTVSTISLAAIAREPRAAFAQTGWTTGHKEKTANGTNWTDFENPVRDSIARGVGFYRITVCDNGAWGRWELFSGERARAEISGPSPAPARGHSAHASMKPTSGTNGAVEIRGSTPGENDFTFTLTDVRGARTTVRLHVRVVPCTRRGVRGLPGPAVHGGG